jgi:hypothetical protein
MRRLGPLPKVLAELLLGGRQPNAVRSSRFTAILKRQAKEAVGFFDYNSKHLYAGGSSPDGSIHCGFLGLAR